MAPHISIIYFDVRGRAELSRLILTAAGHEFEDVRHSFETWPAEKPNTPFGQMPNMIVNGKRFAQGVAMANFVARQFNFYGDSNLDGLAIDQVVQLLEDFRKPLIAIYYEKDEEKKAELNKKMEEEEYPKYLGFFEKLLKENGTGFFVGNRLSLADFAVYDALYNGRKAHPDVFASYPLVLAVMDTVEANDKIKAYLAKRKETPL